MRKFIFPALTIFAFSFSAALADDTAAAKKLFEEKCGSCHPTDQALKISKDSKILADTVKLMMFKKAGFISEAEGKIITDYLLGNTGK